MAHTELVENGEQEFAEEQAAQRELTIMDYITGLMVGSVPQEFYNLMVKVCGIQRVNQVIALAGVKYMETQYSTHRANIAAVIEANKDATIDEEQLLQVQLAALEPALAAIFG